MSFGIGIGDFVTVLDHAKRLRKGFVEAPAQFKALSDEVRNLSIVVQDIEVDLCNASLSSEQKAELQKIAETCQNVLTEIDGIIDRYYEINESHGIKKAWKRLRWEPDDVRDLRNHLCGNISILNAFNGRVTRNNVMELLKYQTNEQQQKCLDWLSPNTYAAQQSDYIRRRQPGTGVWLLESPDFRRWIGKPDLQISHEKTKYQTLFCPGIPGAGKTILASVVIDDLESLSEPDGREPPGEILRQLAQSFSPMPDVVRVLYETHGTKGKRPSVEDISRALRSVADGFSRLFLVVDALDECHYPAISRFLDEIFDLQMTVTADLNILATSRFIPEIMAKFQNMPMQEIRAAKPDVVRYLSANLNELPSFVSRVPQLQQEITNSITDAVDGMFLLAQLYLHSLRGNRSPKAIRSELQKLTGTYDSAYDNAMHRIDCQHEDQKKMARDALLWVTCAKRPLTTVELRHALAVELDESEFDEENLPDLDDIISVCAGLVTVTADTSSDIIRLVHYTTREYFQRTWTRWFPDAHRSIATTCVTYLSFDVFQIGACLSDAAFESRLDNYPLYSYASRKWAQHAREQPISEDLILTFLRDSAKVNACTQALLSRKQFSSKGNYSCRVPRGFTGLHLAAYFGLESAVLSMLQDCDQSHVVDSMGRTPLTWAAYCGHDAIVKIFLDKGVNAHKKDVDGRTPISLAASRGWMRVTSLLIEYQIDPNSRDVDDQTPLSWAAYQGHEDIVRLLLEKGANPDSRDKNGLTPLSWAASGGWIGILEILLEQRADVNSMDIRGRTPVHWALENNHMVAANLLLEKSLLLEKVVQSYSTTTTDHTTVCQSEPTRRPGIKCPLCFDELPRLVYSRGAFMRHLDNRHYPRYYYWCSEASCSDGTQRKPISARRDKVKVHFETMHEGQRLSPKEVDRIREEEPHPQICPVCQTIVSSWEEFHRCIFSHAKTE